MGARLQAIDKLSIDDNCLSDILFLYLKWIIQMQMPKSKHLAGLELAIEALRAQSAVLNAGALQILRALREQALVESDVPGRDSH